MVVVIADMVRSNTEVRVLLLKVGARIHLCSNELMYIYVCL